LSKATCNTATVQRAVFAFAAAFNRGDQTRLRRLWSQPDFQWYSVTRTQATHYVSYDRGRTLRYFRARHRQRETLRLTRLKFNGVSAGFGHVEYALIRRARDLAGGAAERYHGKGAASCAGTIPRLVVWSMGRD
jgi:hypothetical protein